MQIFADPETMARMSEQFMRAASLGNSVDGLLRTMPPQGQELLTKLASTIGAALKPADVPTGGNSEPAATPPPTPVEAKPAKRA